MPEGFSRWYLNMIYVVAAFLISIPVAFVIDWAWVLWIVVPPIADRRCADPENVGGRLTVQPSFG